MTLLLGHSPLTTACFLCLFPCGKPFLLVFDDRQGADGLFSHGTEGAQPLTNGLLQPLKFRQSDSCCICLYQDLGVVILGVFSALLVLQLPIHDSTVYCLFDTLISVLCRYNISNDENERGACV